MIGFIDTYTFTQFGTTGNYSAIVNLPTSQITRKCSILVLVLFYTLLFLCSKLDSQSSQSESQSYVTTDGQPASLSWNKAPIWGLRPDLDYCLKVAGLLIWGALSDERTGLSVAIATGPRQCSLKVELS
jgi:hypothetical protein